MHLLQKSLLALQVAAVCIQTTVRRWLARKKLAKRLADNLGSQKVAGEAGALNVEAQECHTSIPRPALNRSDRRTEVIDSWSPARRNGTRRPQVSSPSKRASRAGVKGSTKFSFKKELAPSFSFEADEGTTATSPCRRMNKAKAGSMSPMGHSTPFPKVPEQLGTPLEEEADAAIESALKEGLIRPLQWNSEIDTTGAVDSTNLMLWAALEMRLEWRNRRAYCVESGTQATVYDAVRLTLATPCERLLWHGTSWASVQNIMRGGFNRAYSGRHGTKFGNGTYFAVSPDYALRFCDPGRPRAVLLARVLVGRYVKGAAGMMEPPIIEEKGGDDELVVSPSTSRRRYDSTVDDIDHPHIYCIFRDFQAIPVGLVVLG